MGNWERHYIVFYNRYIDNIIVTWDGLWESISSFVSYCNANSSNINFTYIADPGFLVFFFSDLVLSTDEKGNIIFKTYLIKGRKFIFTS